MFWYQINEAFSEFFIWWQIGHVCKLQQPMVSLAVYLSSMIQDSPENMISKLPY